jgi:hypothetical protein
MYTSKDIVLKNGVYDSTEPFDNYHGNRLYAETLGQAVLKAGIILGGSWGPGGGVVRGVAFDVTAESKTLQGSLIHVWGTGANSQILDVTLEGHMTISAGIIARQVEGLVIRRVVARHFKNWGILVDRNQLGATVSNRPIVEDITAAFVTWPIPRGSNGTAEACVWIGNTATVRRIDVHDCAWEGLWAGTAAKNALYEDVNAHDNEIGVYFEHYNNDSTIRRLKAGPNVRIGVMCEWADPAWGSIPGCTNMIIEQSYFDTELAGVVLDEGTKQTTVRSSTFVNQCWAAIGNYLGVGNLWDTGGNNYSGIKPGAVAISTKHYYTGTCA